MDFDKWASLRLRLEEGRRRVSARDVLVLMDELESAERFWVVANMPISAEARQRAREMQPMQLPPREEQGRES